MQVEPVADATPTERAVQLAREYRAVIENIVEARGVPQVAEFLRGISDPGAMADTSGYSPDLSFEQKVEVLEAIDVEQRLEIVLGWSRDVLADLELKEKIRTDVSEGMEKRQREFLLREQMSAIRKELGEDSEENVVEEYRRKIAEAGMPEDVEKEALRELGRLERTSEQSPEQGWIRTYLDWMIELPWNVRTDDNLDIAEARVVLDADHEGLQDVKDRILEYLAVRKLRQERGLGEATGRGSGAILTLVGPPGVGKTSLGESVARALGRKFVRVSLGGIHDEAEIRGHRRTYVGALPGRIVRALKDAGTKNPVMMLDEIDKVGADWRGDPSSARCSRSWTPRRTTRSATTTSTSTSTCRRCCSSRPRTSPRRSPARSTTGWRSSGSTATPRTRRSPSRSTTWSRGSSSGTAFATTRSC